ncbi:MAG: hypothetical protein JW986_05050 [Methanotrichaceae archaeon]|nr:hypothetical protein [Methanotrichaceae archaeon]
MFRYTASSGIEAFAWGQFFDDGDSISLDDPPSTAFAANIHYRSLAPTTYLECHARYANDEEDSHIIELEKSTMPDEETKFIWKTIPLANMEELDEITVLPFPATDVQFILRREGEPSVAAQFKEIGWATLGGSNVVDNWEATWRGMDFEIGDAANNFDNINLAHHRDTDYIEFSTQMEGNCTIKAYCRSHPDEDGAIRIKVNGETMAEITIDNSEDYEWRDLWTGYLYPDDVIRIENNEWEEESSSLLFFTETTFHDSFISFANEGSGAPAFRIVPESISQPPQESLPDSPPPIIIINEGDDCTGFPDVSIEIENPPPQATALKVRNQNENYQSVESQPISDTVAHTLEMSSTHQSVSVAFFDDAGERISWIDSSSGAPKEAFQASDGISLDLAIAKLEPFPAQFTAFEVFDVTVSGITPGVERLDILVKEGAEGDWQLHRSVAPFDQGTISIPFNGEPLETYIFSLRVSDCAGKSRDQVCSDQSPCPWVKVVPHNLDVTAEPVNSTSVLFSWENQNPIGFSAYSIFVDAESPIDIGDTSKMAFHTTDVGDQVPEEGAKAIVCNLNPGALYHYVFLAHPVDRSKPVLISGDFSMPTYGERLDLGFERSGPTSIRAEWIDLSDLPEFSKYRLVLNRTDTGQSRAFEIHDRDMTHQDISGLSQRKRYSMTLEVFDDEGKPYLRSDEISFTLERVQASDLAIDQLEVSQTMPGEEAEIAFRVRNIGNLDLNDPYVSRAFYRPPEGGPDDLVLLAQDSGGPLSSSDASGQLFSLDVELSSEIEVGGTIEVWVDSSPDQPLGTIPELDEENNAAAYTITTLLPPLPDLTIPLVQVLQGGMLADKLLPGHNTRFEIKVSNDGLATALPFTIAIYYQETGPADEEPSLLAKVDSNGTLGPGQEKVFDIEATLPDQIENGDSIVISVDPESLEEPFGKVLEESEENNRAVIEVQVRVPVEQISAGEGQDSEDATLQQMAEAYAEMNWRNMARYSGEENVEVSANAVVEGSEGTIRVEACVLGRCREIQTIYYRKIDPSGPDQASNWQQVDFKNTFT